MTSEADGAIGAVSRRSESMKTAPPGTDRRGGFVSGKRPHTEVGRCACRSNSRSIDQSAYRMQRRARYAALGRWCHPCILVPARSRRRESTDVSRQAATSTPPEAPNWSLAPVESGDTLLRLCVALVPDKASRAGHSFVGVNETLDAVGVLGCFADRHLVPSRWVVIWLGRTANDGLDPDSETLRPSNPEILRRWEAAWRPWDPRRSPLGAIGWNAEATSSDVLLLSPDGSPPLPLTVGRERLPVRLCTDDALLEANGLPTYSGGTSRFLIAKPTNGDPRFVWLSGGDKAPEGSVDIAELAEAHPGHVLFNAGGGLLGAFPFRVTPFHPVSYPDLTAALHGEALRSDLRLGATTDGPRADLEGRTSPLLAQRSRGLAARVRSDDAGRFFGSQDSLALRHLEANYLRVQAIADILCAVRDAVDHTGLPLFNLAPESFLAEIESPREGVPFLWQARVRLARPGSAREATLSTDPPVRQFIRPNGTSLDALAPTRAIPDYRAEGLISDVSDSGPNRVVLKGQLTPRMPVEVATTDLLQFYLKLGDRPVLVHARPLQEIAGRQTFQFRSLPFQPPAGSSVRAGATVSVFVTTIPLEGTPHDLYAIFVLACRLLIAGGSPLSTAAPHATEEAQTIAKLESLLMASSSVEGSAIASPLFTRAADLDPRLYPAPLRAAEGSPSSWPVGIPIPLWSDLLRALGQLRPGWPGCGCKDFSHFESDAPGRVFDAPLATFTALAARLRTSLLGERSIDSEIRAAALALIAESRETSSASLRS